MAALRFCACVSWMLFLVAAADASSGAVTILYPPDRAVFAGAGLPHIVLEVSGDVKLSLRLNGKPIENPAIKDRFYHYLLRLDFGRNEIELEATGDKGAVVREKRALFFFSPIAKDKEIPDGFARAPFHQSGKTPGVCAGCHLLEAQPGDRAPVEPSRSTCFVCHKSLTGFKNVHGPASRWDCLACHDMNSTPVKYATPTPVRELCFRCHTDLKNYYYSANYQHGPTATGMCTICHSPHATDNEFWLKKPPWDLCTTCHTEKASGRHILAWGPTGNTHPTRGRPDPMKPEREFSCRSCHNPHASNSPKMWNFDARETYDLCWTCHRK